VVRSVQVLGPPRLSTQTSANLQRPCDGLLKPNHDEFGFAMLCLEEQYAKISILWNIPLPVRIVAKRFRWCWTYPCTSKLMWKIAKCAATPLRSVTPCRTKSWWNFRPGLWDDRRPKCQRILQRNPVIRPAVDHAIRWEGSGLHSCENGKWMEYGPARR